MFFRLNLILESTKLHAIKYCWYILAHFFTGNFFTSSITKHVFGRVRQVEKAIFIRIDVVDLTHG